MTALSVKVPKDALVTALQGSLDAEIALPESQDYQDQYTAAQAAFQKTYQSWGMAVAKILAKGNGAIHSGYGKRITYDLTTDDFPAAPEFKAPDRFPVQDAMKIRNLKNAIVLLNLSQEEFVNASTYKSVVQYL